MITPIVAVNLILMRPIFVEERGKIVDPLGGEIFVYAIEGEITRIEGIGAISIVAENGEK